MEASDKDENWSWRAATVIMILATIFTATTWFVGMGPFTIIFDSFVVYLPTGILVSVDVVHRLRSRLR